MVYWRYPRGKGSWLHEELSEEEALIKEKTLLDSGFDVLVGKEPPHEYLMTRRRIDSLLRQFIPLNADVRLEEELARAILPPFNLDMLRKYSGIVRSFIDRIRQEMAISQKFHVEFVPELEWYLDDLESRLRSVS